MRPRQRRRREYARTQRAFRRNPREVALDILGEGGPQGDDAPPVRQFFDELMMSFGTPSPPDRARTVPRRNPEVIASLDPIAKREVIRALKVASKTAAGPLNPNLDIGALKRLGEEVLARIYDVWLYLEVVPQWVKACRTTMILKKEPRNDVRNWRPITIGSHYLRLFCKILAARLAPVVQMDQAQKAFRQVDGCGEHAATLDGVIWDAQQRKRNLCVTFIDIERAFDTVSHESVDRALQIQSAPYHIRGLLRELRVGVDTQIEVSGEVLEPIPMQRGVKQGCPLSPLLFNLVIDEFVSGLDRGFGYALSCGTKVAVLAFTDDLVLVSGSKPGMRSMISRLEELMEARNLQINAAKCASIVLERPSGQGGMRVVEEDAARFALHRQGAREPMVQTAGYTKYLGLEVGPSGIRNTTRNQDEEVARVEELLGRIGSARLKPMQKLIVLREYMVPRMLYKYSKGPCSLNLLDRLDQRVRTAVKRWLHLPRTIPTALLKLSLRDGGTAVPALVEKVALAKMRLMHSLNVSEDPVVRAVITADLWGHDARNLARHFQLEDFSHDAARAWKSQLRRKHKDDWSRSWHGSGAQAFFDDPGANRLMRSADVSGRLPLDLLRLRAQTGNCRVSAAVGRVPNRELANLTCRHCQEGSEDLCHLLQRCPVLRHHRVRRHNRILAKMTTWLNQIGWTVVSEPTIRSGHTVIRPDLVIQKDDSVRVLDLFVPWERSVDALAKDAKVERYRPFDADIHRYIGQSDLFAGHDGDIEYHRVAVGARGGIQARTRRLLGTLGIRRGAVALIQELAIRGSVSMLNYLPRA